MKTQKQQSDLIHIERGKPPLALFFIVVPSLTLVALIATIATQSFPLPLLGLLAVVGICCLLWVREAIGQVGATTLELTKEELKVKRMLGGDSFSWSFIEAIKVCDPGPTLGDSGRHDDVRAGLGLYLKNGGKERLPDAPPDVLIVSGSGDLAAPIVKAAERLTSYHRKAANSSGKGGAAQAGFNKARKPFRKPTAASAA
jgi:hypothetical protein